MDQKKEINVENFEEGLKAKELGNNSFKKQEGEVSFYNKNVDEIFINSDAVNKPIVFFVGPREIGKTVTLIRLLKLMDEKGIGSFKINDNFISDKSYNKVTESFISDLNNSNYSPARTGNISFLLIDIFLKSELFCHLLEVPGEHYFDTDYPDNSDFKNYLSKLIFGNDQKKIFIMFFEDAMLGQQSQRIAYSKRLASIIKRLDPKKDRIIILFNKVDSATNLWTNGKVNDKTLRSSIIDNPSFLTFKNAINESKIKSIMWVPFSSGTFHSVESSGNKTWAIGKDIYPEQLWKSIYSCIRPSWF